MPTNQYKAGYEYLLAYKITIPIYDYTVIFCKKYHQMLSSHRTYDQMVQAARSGLEELLKDFLSFARQNQVGIWGKEKSVGEIREVGEVWEILKKTPTLPNFPNFPDLPNDLTPAVNLIITLVNQAIYLQKRLQQSLEKKFVEEGGFRENLFKRRLLQKKQE